jgi:SulP family sulfate permease
MSSTFLARATQRAFPLQTAQQDLVAGAVSSVLSITYGLSFATLIFSGPLIGWIGYGIGLTLVITAISSLLMAMRSSLPFAIAGPDVATSTVTAALVTTLLQQQAIKDSPPEHWLGLATIVMALSAALAGLLMLGLGLARAGSAIRFVPYPVIGGFLGATGLFLLGGAVEVITGDRLSFAAIGSLFSGVALAKLAAGGLLAGVLYLVLAKSRAPLLMPAILLVGIAAAYGAFSLAGVSLEDAHAAGWLFTAPPLVKFSLTWEFDEFRNFPWWVLPSLSGDLLAVVFVATVSTLLNTTGIERATRREASIERELKTAGLANLLSACVGGYTGCTALNRTMLNYEAGGRGRLSGLCVAAVSVLALGADPSFLSYVPRFVLGGLLLYLAATLIFVWLVASARRISALEYASLIAIALIIMQWGFVAGVVTGVIVGCAIFALGASRVNSIRFSFDGSEYRSSLDRGPDELSILAHHGDEVQGMGLQSYLFFGLADKLYQHVKSLLASRPQCRFLLFDFHMVTGIDSSAVHSFTQIKQAADAAQSRLVFVGASDELLQKLRTGGLGSKDIMIFSDLDQALESCEQELIAAHASTLKDTNNLREWLGHALGSSDLADQLAQFCEHLEVGRGDIIAAEGEVADSMLFIVEGRVGVFVRMNGHTVRVRSLGPNTTIGEMGLMAQRPRSATIKAEAPSVLYVLKADAYERLQRENPALSQRLLTYVISVMAERLSFQSRMPGILRR